MKTKSQFFLFITLLLSSISVEASIKFKNIEISEALELGRERDQLIFVDTYATWCGPCKIMDKIFEQEAVAQFYNDNFVNVKIDMDGPLGKSIGSKYGVVWLPTLLIIDQNTGEVISKIDRLVDSQELIRIGRKALAGLKNTYVSGNLENMPFKEGQSNNSSSNSYEEPTEAVVYVHDERVSSGRPNIMYHEAYLHLQLMDGKHQQVARRYLSTQKDWSTEKNLKFIFDFMNSTNSKEFEYFISNQEKFAEIIGAERISRTLGILVHQRLYQGFPRPELDEAIKLYSYIDPEASVFKGYKYSLNALDLSNRDLEYISLAEDYLTLHDPYDTGIIYKLVKKRMNRSDANHSIEENISLLKNSLNKEIKNPLIYKLLSELYLEKGSQEEALDFIDKAIQLATIERSAELNDLLSFKKSKVIN